MTIGRSFFVGAEPTKRWGPFTIFDRKARQRDRRQGNAALGITRIDDGNRLSAACPAANARHLRLPGPCISAPPF